MKSKPQTFKKQIDIEHKVLIDIMTKTLKREPAPKDRLQFEIITHPRYDDRYLFSHNGTVLGMVKRSFELLQKTAGFSFVVNFDSNEKSFYKHGLI